MPRQDFRFAYRKRVHYPEIDTQGVLFNPRYLEYFAIGVAEYWREIGMDMPGTGKAEYHVAKVLVEYKAPILLDEEIDICVRCARIGTSSKQYSIELHGAGRDDLRATGEKVTVHVAEARGRSAPMPAQVVEMLETYEGRRLRAAVEAA